MPTKRKTPPPGLPPGLELAYPELEHPSGVNAIAWSPDGRLLATGCTNGSTYLWDAKTGARREELPMRGKRVLSLAFSPSGDRLASADGGDGMLRVWDLTSSVQVLEIDAAADSARSHMTFELKWAPDGRRLASLGHGKTDYPLRIWSASTGKLIAEWNSNSYEGLLWAPSGELFANLDGTPVLVGLDDTAVKRKFGNATDSLCLAYRKADATLACGHRGGKISLWDVRSGKLSRVLEGHKANVIGLSFNSTGALLASVSGDSTARIWRGDTWDTVAAVRAQYAFIDYSPIAFHPSIAALATTGAESNRSVQVLNVDLAALLGEEPVTQSIHYTNAKVVLLGESSTGKTCLARALMGLPFQPQESTHGMKVWTFGSEVVEQEGAKVTRETMLWDLAGQVDYRVVHQLFLDETVLAVVTFDACDPDDPFAGVGYWEKALARVLARGCPKLLVAGRVDRGHPTATKGDIEAFRNEHDYHSFIATSAKTGHGVEDLRTAIRDAIPWDQMPITTSPQLWREIRNYLLKRRSGRHVLSTRANLRSAFRRSRKAEGPAFSESDFDTVVRHAQAQGLVWQLSFGDLVLLRPELLNAYAAAIVRAARKHPQGLGSVAERDVLSGRFDFEDMKRLPDEVERKLLYAAVELFLSRELAWRGGADHDQLVFPSKFNRTLPDLPHPPRSEELVHFSGPVEHIYATLTVRLFYSDAFELQNLWKDAAEFRDALGSTCGLLLERPEEGKGTVSVFFDEGTAAQSRVLFKRFVHEHLRERAVQDTVRRERVLRCPSCEEEVSDRRAIAFRIEKGYDTIRCSFCDTHIALVDALDAELTSPETVSRLRELNAQVTRRRVQAVGLTTARAKDSVGQYDVFLAHNSKDQADAVTIADALRARGLNPWLDKERIPPGRWFHDVIQKAIGEVGSAAILIGPSGLGRWQTMELRAFVEQCVDRSIPVMPVLLPRVNDIPADLLFLKQLHRVRFERDLDEIEAIDALVWGITGEHPSGTTEDAMRTSHEA